MIVKKRVQEYSPRTHGPEKALNPLVESLQYLFSKKSQAKLVEWVLSMREIERNNSKTKKKIF